MNGAERFFVALAAAGFAGLIGALGWIGLIWLGVLALE